MPPALRTSLPSKLAAEAPDTAESIEKFMEAYEVITGEKAPDA